MANYNEIIQKPAFALLEPERRAMLAEMMSRLEGKSQMEAFIIIGEFMQKIPKGKELSKPERDALLEAAIESMPESDRKRFESLLKMMESVIPKQ